MRPFSLNIKGKLIEYRRPAVMGILNITPDSFYAGSRSKGTDEIRRRVAVMMEEGADIIDVGAYSTRPGAGEVTEEEELRRLSMCLSVLREEASEAVVSVDTFRARVAEKAVTEMGADIVNDISGTLLDERMMETVARLKSPYILNHCRGTSIADIHHKPEYNDFLADVISDLAKKVSDLQLMGVNDLIIDPGFGFGKTMEQNYHLLENMELLEIFHLPILAGISRKSMITKLLDITPEEALNGTNVLNTIALQKGASMLRVHDVKAAKETVKIYEYLETLKSC